MKITIEDDKENVTEVVLEDLMGFHPHVLNRIFRDVKFNRSIKSDRFIKSIKHIKKVSKDNKE